MNKVLIILIAAVTLTACGRAANVVDAEVTRYHLRAGYNVHEFRLQDGTRCVAIEGGGIACQW